MSKLEAKMLSYAKVQSKPQVLQSLTGLTVAEFEQLLVSFEQAWQGYVEQHHLNTPDRQRRYGGGRSPKLKQTCDKLLYILMYFRLYLEFSGVSLQSKRSEWKKLKSSEPFGQHRASSGRLREFRQENRFSLGAVSPQFSVVPMMHG